MSEAAESERELIEKACAGDGAALAGLFRRHCERLRQMIRLRLDRRLQGRLDDSDILQESYLEASKRIGDYAQQKSLPFFLWLRLVVGQKLVDVHRFHLGAQMRDAAREVSLYRGPMPEASSVALAAQLLGRLTSPTQALARAETKLQIETALNNMDEMDRQVLTLRHFESLTNAETAQVLGISVAAASNRYVRALQRLKGILEISAGPRRGVDR